MKNINERGLYLACGYDKVIETEDFGIQLVLRKSEDMTEEERDQFVSHCSSFGIKADNFEFYIPSCMQVTMKLLEWGIDVFGLIDRGEAINEKELK